MKRVIWLIFKVIGMAFVLLVCVKNIRNMAMVTQMTGNYLFLIVCLVISALLVFWAYLVIWKPIKRRRS